MRLNLRESLLYWLLWLFKAADGRDTDIAAFDPEHVRSILVISSTALGDTVLSTAAIVALRRRYPGIPIVALIHRAYIDLFRRLPELSDVIAYHGAYRRFWRTARQLRKPGFDLALILHGNEPQATPLAYLSGVRFIFKLPNTSAFRFLLSNREPVLTSAQLGHGMEQRLRVVSLAGADVTGARMKLPVTEDDCVGVERWLHSHGVIATMPLIGFQTGASSRSRMWPAEKFVELARDIIARHPLARFVLSGSAAEAAYCRRIAEAVGAAAVVAAGVVSVAHLPALVGRMRLLVSGDTGTMHVAVAVATPVVALFAVSDPKMSGPAYDLDRHIVIHRPCADPGIRSKSDDQTCIGRIPVADVLAAVDTILARGAAK